MRQDRSPRREAPPPLLQSFVIIGSLILAARNILKARGDREGAFRFATTICVLSMSLFFLEGGMDLFTSRGATLIPIATIAFYFALGSWVGYIALEPIVRGMLPQSLIAWTRLLKGRWADPLVRKEILIGLCLGIIMSLVHKLGKITPFYHIEPTPYLPTRGYHPTPEFVFGGLLDTFNLSINLGVSILLLFSLLLLVGRTVIATSILLFAIVFASPWVSGQEYAFLESSFGILQLSFVLFCIVRLGLVAVNSCMFGFLLTTALPLALDPGHYFSPFGMSAALTVVTFSLFGFVVSTRPRGLFKKLMLEES